MNDELRDCECGKQHPWGIVKYSDDRVPLYGPRDIDGCDHFRPVLEPVPAGVNAQELWAQTADLDAQADVQTRLVVSGLRSLANRKAGMAAVAAMMPEFMNFMIASQTKLTGSLLRNESKFAHLVAHTDEIVEAMRKVTQLSEQLDAVNLVQRDILDQIGQIRADRNIKYSAEVEAFGHFGLLPFPGYPYDGSEGGDTWVNPADVSRETIIPFPWDKVRAQSKDEPVEVSRELKNPDLDDQEMVEAKKRGDGDDQS